MTPRESAETEDVSQPAPVKHATSSRDVATPGLFAEFQRTRDPQVRDRLVLAHMNLVRYLARKFSNRGEPLEDLVQVGMIGLINAIDRFDPTRGIRFATYATPTIVGEIRRHFRDRGWAVKVPRRLQELNLAANKAVEAHVERSDVTAVPAARVVAEAVVAYVVAAAYLDKFGGDSLLDVLDSLASYERRLEERGLWRRS